MRNFIFLSLTVFLALAITKTAFSDNRYWVNGSGNWNDPQQWSETSGGIPGASIPTKEDHVIFDHNSFTSNDQTVIIKDKVYCTDFRWEVDNYQPKLKSSAFIFKKLTKAEIEIHGSLIIGENINNAFFGDIVLKSSGNSTINIDSKLTADLIIDAENGAYILNNDFESEGDIYFKSGDFNTNNKNIATKSFIATGSNKRNLDIGNSDIAVDDWDFAESENLKLISENSRLLFTKEFSKKNFKPGGLSYNSLTKAGAKSSFTYTITITDITCNGSEDGIITAEVTSGGTSPFTYTLYDDDVNVLETSGPIASTNYTFQPNPPAPGVSGGSYLVRIKDDDGTTNGEFIFVDEPLPLSADSISVITPLSCFDGSDAELEAFASGGTEPYSYHWVKYNTSNSTWEPIGQTTKIATNISQGIYRVYIDDDNSCGPEYVNKYFTNPPDDENIPEEIDFNNISHTNSCQGSDNGTITLEASGGTGDIDYYLIRLSDMQVIPAGPPYDEDGYFTGLQPDTYETYAIDENGCTKQGADVEITETTNPTADAGTGGDECGLDFSLNATPSIGVGTWTFSGPGNATFNPNANDPNATVTVDAYGSYDFIWTEDNDGCTDQDQITVNFYEQPIADAGTGGDECDFNFILNATPSVGNGTWAQTSGPGTSTFTPNANDPNATVEVTAYGSYEFTWTEDNNGCIDADQITVNFYEQPVADAGAGGSVCGFDFGLNATPSVGTGTWTYSGPGNASFAPDANDPNAAATVDAYGTYTFTWTEVNGSCSDSDDAIVDYLETPVADAGTGGDECDFDFVLNANPSVGTGTWSSAGPGTASFAPDANDPNATVTVDAYGTYTFTWTEVNGICNDDDDVIVNFYEQPTADAGTGGDECDFDYVLNATPSVGTGTWTFTGPGNANFAPDVNDPNATVTVDAYGTYTFTWTEVNGSCSDNDDVVVNFYEQPTADAGAGGDECDLDFVLNANPSVGTGTWTSAGPGTASFAPDANDPNATVTVSTYGTYTFTWTEENGTCSDNDDVVVNFYEQPTANAGAGGDECDFDFVLNATPSVGVGTWTFSGPGNANFAPDANDPNATVTVDAYGSYDFTWTEDNNGCIDADQITVNFYEQPTADAGAGGSVCGFDFGLNATPSVGNGTWTYSGPGNASFAPDANDPNATATVDAYGTYTFTWTEVNGSCSDSDDAIVDYLETPVADAGTGGDECDFDFVLNANPSVGTGTWSSAGPGTASFAPNANDPNATVTVNIYGTYTFTWTEVNGICSDNDDVVVNFYEQPTADAGTGGDECDLDFVLNANPSVGTGTWTYVGTGNASFVPDANDPNATVTVDAYGTYTFTWTEVNGSCSDNDDVVVNFYEQPTADAGTGGDECDLDFVLNANPSVGTGTWSSAGPGTASFAPDANDPNATVTVGAYGTYTFTWTEANGSCSDNDNVVVNFYEQPTADAGTGGDECDFDFVLNATPSVGTGTWTQTSGPGTSTFTPNANDPNATVEVTAYGSYEFTWTEDNNGCVDADQIIVNFYEQPTADAGAGGSVCGFDFGLNATPSVGNGTWTYSGPGNASFAPDANDPNATATVDAYGTYTFTWTEVNGSCSDSDNISVEYTEAPTAYAGIDTLLCYDTDYTILDADTANCAGLSWSTEGDGTFDDANVINPTYTAGLTDLANGYVDLVLTAIGNPPCADATDTVRINYLPRLRASIGKPAPFFIDSTSTHIDVYVKMSNHEWLAHVGVYLVSPNDSVIELKQECEVIFPIAFVDNATWNFYNDPEDSTSLTPISSCSPTTTGRFLFSGDWKGLHGQDPANGAWRIRVVDYENSGPPGLLEEATIKFSDYNDEGIFESILYADSSINKPIKRFSGVSGPGITSHTLSITGLTTSCYGVCDATAVGTASGGQPPYVSYEWSDVPDFSNIIATTDTIDLCAGTFYLRITDSHGCTAIDSVTVGEPSEIIIDSDTVVHNICYGDTLGKIALAFSGGTGALQYTHNGTDWYNSGDTIENLAAGDYLVTIIDANQCTKDTLITINQPTPIDISTNVTPISCYGNDDGEIEIIASGGTPGVITPYTYSIDSASTWDPGNIFAPLSPDTFYIAVQDSLGCIQYGDTVYMNNPDSITIDSVSIAHVICDGSATDGEIVVYARGGSGDLEYSVNNGADYYPDSLFTGLSGGDYQIAVRDVKGCTKFLDSLVTINGPVVITSDTVVHNQCYGDTLGKIALAFSGGTGALQYTINGTDWYNSGDTIENLGAGDYVVSIEDATGCTKDTLITITEPTPIDISTTVTPITCFEADDGQIEITATGGTPGVITPYQYSIDSAATWNPGNIFAPLSPDTFYIAVQDSLGCIQFGDTVFMNYPDTISIDSVSISHVICDGSAVDGEIVIHANGGSGDLSYSINNGTDYYPDSLFTGLSGGDYQIAVQDERGCTKFLDSLVTVNGPIVITSDTVVHNQCYGDSIGRIALAFTGGTGALQYTINGTDWYNSGDTIENLGAGDYVVSIEDASGCAKDTLITITEPTPIDITTTYTGISCNGSNDGQIEITATGGTPGIINPYEYSIDSAQTWQFSNIFGSLSNDTFYVAVQDSLGCVQFGDTIEMLNPDTISIDAVEVIPTTCSGSGNDGQIVVHASGGSGTLSYSTDRITFQLSDTLKWLPLGDTTVYVTDSKCDTVMLDSLVTITGPVPVSIDSVRITSPVNCNGGSDGEITVYASGGNRDFTYYINGVPNNPANDSIFTGLSADSYDFRVERSDGCVSPDSTKAIEEPTPVIISGYTVTHTSECNTPQNVGEISVNGIGGTPGYRYALVRESDGDSTTNTSGVFSGLQVDDYRLYTIDNNGCVSNRQDTAIILYPAMDITITGESLRCHGEKNGTAEVDFVIESQGVMSYTYLWEDSLGTFLDNTKKITGLEEGWYYVTVTDNNSPDNCMSIDSIEITQPDSIRISVTTKDIFCVNSSKRKKEDANGKINVDVTGGTFPYEYIWLGPSLDTLDFSSDYITNIEEEGPYSLVVIDDNGCDTTFNTTITKSTAYDLEFDVEIEDTSICWYQPLHFTINSTNADTIMFQKFKPASDWVMEVTGSTMDYYYDELNSDDRFDIYARNEYCYEDTSDISIVYYPDRELNIVREEEGRDTIIIKGENGRWEAMASVNNSNGLIVNWSPTEGVSAPDSLFTRITPTESTWYRVKIITQEGDCADADSIYITYVPDIVTYDGFSPNGDGINDFWYIENIDAFENNIVTVFNRWGTKVYEQKGYSNDDSNRRWDGTAKNGKAVGSGTYYYVIILNEEGFSPLTGAITIMR